MKKIVVLLGFAVLVFGQASAGVVVEMIAGDPETAGEAKIGLRHLPLELPNEPDRDGAPPAFPDSARSEPPRTTLRELERRAILQARRRCNGNRTYAARLLGIDRSTLRRKIREFGLDPASST